MIYNSPIGKLIIEIADENINRLSFSDSHVNETESGSQLESAIKEQLSAYFNGQLSSFDLPIKPKGTNFELSVWNEVIHIPFGSTTSYGAIAKKLGDANLMRAVGRANGSNPIPIIIPCHRVIASNNHLTGYSGGLERKKWLLKHEGTLLL